MISMFIRRNSSAKKEKNGLRHLAYGDLYSIWNYWGWNESSKDSARTREWKKEVYLIHEPMAAARYRQWHHAT
jgi:hypothetical protein